MSLGEWDWSESAVCPHSFECTNNLESFDIGRAPSYVSLASSSLSCMGSILIVLTYCFLKDMRSGAQTIITLLAIADFFTAFGYIMGGVNFLLNFKDKKVDRDCPTFTSICEIQSFITTWSTMSSYCWNCILAFYFFLVVGYGNQKLGNRLLPLYNIIAWIGPLLIVFPLLVENKLGYAPYVASNWCYIKDMDYKKSITEKIDTIVYILIAGKFWEVLCYCVILVLYIWIKFSVNKTQSRLRNSANSVSLPKKMNVEKRLLAIPILYIILRIWGTLQFFYSLIVSNSNYSGCIPSTVKTVYIVFGILQYTVFGRRIVPGDACVLCLILRPLCLYCGQAIGDSGQGWCNAILYIILSPIMRRKLCGEPCENCLQATERKLQKFIESDSSDQTHFEEEAVVSDIDTYPSGADVDCERNDRAVDAAGYKIQKYDSTTSLTIQNNTSSRAFSISNKINS